MTIITIVPEGSFSLRAAAGFGFGPNTGRPVYDASHMRLVFVTDDLQNQAAVNLSQDPDGVVTGEVTSDADDQVVEDQVRRILSLDHSGVEWARVGEKDEVVRQLQDTHEGLRPVLFHSPYEAAAWSIVSARRQRAQAIAIRTRLAAAHGRRFVLNDEETFAFPTPQALLAVVEVQGLDKVRVDRLHAVARAALEGELEPALLLAMSPDDALEHLQKLPGVGPTYSTLILLRSTGATDIMTGLEPRIASYLAYFYGLDEQVASPEQIERISASWRPFRTWTSVLCRVAGDALELPYPGPTRGH
ncbi:MAG: 3-methyladenine glycosylase/8-oxoguanine glycosylase-like protein [Glaciihabitans sp.]|jgi:DNA-3-methyladenine glycosylase II|nr:3-methyladenine glycosylase/8-oxoguanine glycosylase-like protein [Glaciihabitans sp.]